MPGPNFLGAGPLQINDASASYFLNGNVGIGTTSPGAKLHVSGGRLYLDNNQAIRFLTTAGVDDGTGIFRTAANATRFEFAAQNLLIRGLDPNAGAIRFLDKDNTDVARIALLPGYNTFFNIGNVGIGTTTPGAKLEVTGDIVLSSGADRSIRLPDNSRTLVIGADTEPYAVQLRSASLLVFRTASNTRMTIDSSGNVGIGTTNPGTNLEVYGADAESMVHYSGQSRGGLRALSTQRVALLTTTSGDDLVFGWENGHKGTFTEHMRLDNATGNVGIGTTTPGARLEVNGHVILAGDLTVGGNAVKRPDKAGALGLFGGDGIGGGAYFNAYGLNHATVPGQAEVVFEGANATFKVFNKQGAAYTERLRLDANGNLTVANNIKVWDSGWSDINALQTRDLVHNQNALPRAIQAYFRESAGSPHFMVLEGFRWGELSPYEYGAYIRAITNNSLQLVARHKIGLNDAGNAWVEAGQAKVILWF